MDQSSPVLLHHPHVENNTFGYIVTPPPARTAPLTTLISQLSWQSFLLFKFSDHSLQYSKNQRKEAIPCASESFERIELDIKSWFFDISIFSLCPQESLFVLIPSYEKYKQRWYVEWSIKTGKQILFPETLEEQHISFQYRRGSINVFFQFSCLQI